MPFTRPRFRLWMKLAMLAALGVVLMHVIHLVIGNRIAARALVEAQVQVGQRVARLIAQQAADPLLVEDAMGVYDLVHGAAGQRAGESAYCFILRNGKVVATSFEDGTPPPLVTMRAPGELDPVLVSVEGRQFLDVAEPILGGKLGEVRLGLGLGSLAVLRRDLAIHLGELAVAMIVAGLAAAFLAGRGIARPVAEMLAAVDRFDPSIRHEVSVLTPRGSDEIAVLTDRFNRMMRRLELAYAEQAQARQKQVETQRLAALGSLVAGVAHEVNNPVAGLKNCLRRLERADLTEVKRLEYLDLMREGLVRIEGVVRRLLDFGRPHPPVLEPVSASAIAIDSAKLVEPLLDGCKVTYRLIEEASGGGALADRQHAGQAIVNLLLNALYVTPSGGEIRMKIRARPPFIGISIEDDGPGIPIEIRDRILDPFFSTKPEGKGTGLGLSVTRTIADAHGGELSFEFPARGTVATLWLRAAEVRATAS